MSSMAQTMVGTALASAEQNPHIETALPSGRNEVGSGGLVDRLRGVPKGALRTVLGKEFGERVWRHARGEACPEAAIADAEVVAALVRHLSVRAATELQETDRYAKFVRLTAWCQDGRSAGGRARLPRATREAGEIEATAVALLKGFTTPLELVQSIDLEVTATVDVVAEPSCSLSWLATPAQAVPA